MKLKMIACAALAVCGSAAFADVVACGTPTTAAAMVQNCTPDVTVYIAGASAQKPAIDALLLKGLVFDTTRPVAYIVPSTDKHTTPAASYNSTDGKTVLSGIKNTVIYMGYGKATNPDGTDAAYKDKLVAVVLNTANGSFAGVKQMTKGLPTSVPSDTAQFNETTSFITRVSNQDTASQLTCVSVTADVDPQAGSSTITKFKPATGPSGAVVTTAAVIANVTTLVCNVPSDNYFNYTATTKAQTTANAGLTKGVQLALADVNPVHASPDVAVAVGAPLDVKKFEIVPTAVQGFGVIVNTKALSALAVAQQAAGQLPGCSSDDAAALTTSKVTGACQPNVSRALMTAIVNGTAIGSMVSGIVGDTAKINLQRRTNWSGTQASSNLMFGGYGATEGRTAKDLAGTKFKWVGLAANTPNNASQDIAGATNTWALPGDMDLLGNFTKVSGQTTSVYNVASSDVITNVADNTADYAFGVVSLEKVWSATTSSSGLKGATGNASWVKIDGVSPNFVGADQTIDSKQRKGMLVGYPFQMEMVAIKNTLALTGTSAVVKAQKGLVDNIVTGIKDSTYNLAGLAYLSLATGDTDATRKAFYSRGGRGVNFAPLVVNK